MIGARLAFAGHRVTFLARPRVAEKLRSFGLTLIHDGTRQLLHAHAVTDPADADRPDVILLTVKGYDCLAAAQAIQRTWTDPPPVVCWLNGVGHEATLSARLGPDRVIPAILTTAVQSLEPGVVRVERERGIGLARGLPCVPMLAEAFEDAGMATKLYAAPDAMKWSKLLTNIVGNATSAILGWTVAEVFSHPDVARIEIEALREAVKVMRRLGLEPASLPGVPVRVLGWCLSLPAEVLRPLLQRIVVGGRGKKRPSFHYDIGRGRSEIPWLNGAIVEEGARLGVACPANSVLTDRMLAIVNPVEAAPTAGWALNDLIGAAARAGVPGIRGIIAGPSDRGKVDDL
jgi:2-dehydropantoate 2-reductase